jgi:hypothetical protein
MPRFDERWDLQRWRERERKCEHDHKIQFDYSETITTSKIEVTRKCSENINHKKYEKISITICIGKAIATGWLGPVYVLCGQHEPLARGELVAIIAQEEVKASFLFIYTLNDSLIDDSIYLHHHYNRFLMCFSSLPLSGAPSLSLSLTIRQ